MSKELEALRVLKANAILFDDGTDFGASMLEAISELDNYLTPPTADEVCEALSGWFDEKFYYDVNQKEFYTKALNGQHSVVKLKKNEIHFGGWYTMPPHLITLIGRFYEGLEEME